ncbi:hypothetical protein Trydic_g19440 [Trypoxylus dichotomus]
MGSSQSSQGQGPAEPGTENVFNCISQMLDDECNKRNKALKEKCEALEKTATQLEEDFRKVEEENGELKKKYSLLELNNYFLEKNLEHEKQRGYKLKKSVMENKNIINDCRDSINAKQNEILRYKTDLERECLQEKISEMLQRLVSVEELISTKTREFIEEIKKCSSEEREKQLENFRSECEHYNRHLLERGISPESSSNNLFEEYKSLSHRNGSIVKDVLKTMYKRAKSAKRLRQKWTTFAESVRDDLAELEQLENVVFPSVSVLKDAEEEIKRMEWMLRSSYLKTFQSGYNWLINGDTEELLEIDSDCASSDINDKPKQKKRRNRRRKQQKQTQNNNEPVNNHDYSANTNKSRKAQQEIQKSRKVRNPASKSIILFNVPESKSSAKDRKMILTFLVQNDFEEEEYKVIRLGQFRPNYNRPLVVQFTDEEIVDEILELKRENGWFNGSNPNVRKFF